MNFNLVTADRTARVLIVDDERRNQQLLEAILKPEGYVLEAASSGDAALSMVARQHPDLILLDVMMPGLDGYQVTRTLKANPATSNIPIILVTALDDRPSRMLGLSAGAEDFLSKPIDRAELIVRVKNLLRLKAYGDYYGKYSEHLKSQVASRTAELEARTETLQEQAAALTEQAALLDLARDAIHVRDMQGRIMFWSVGAESMYGWSRAEALKSNMFELLKPKFFEPVEQIQDTLLRTGQWEGEAIHDRHDGTCLHVATRWALQRAADDSPQRILAISNDITGRIHAEAERKMLTERLSLATAVAKVGVWEWEFATNSLTWDATMFALYGLPPIVPMLYQHWSAAVHPEDLAAREAALQKVIAEKSEGSTEFRILLKDRSVRNIQSIERVVLDASGNACRIVGVSMDITGRKQAEREIINARNLAQETARVKSEFLANMNHELRTPMNGILGFTDIMLDTELTGEQQECLALVKKSAISLMALIDNTLSFSDYDSVKTEIMEFDISTCLDDTLEMFKAAASQKQLRLIHNLSPDVPRILAGDRKRLQKALRLLIDNAIKFTDRGQVTVQAGQESRSGNEISMLFTVRDSGIGIPRDKQEMIFSPFTQVDGSATRKYGGAGVGLTVCRRLVELMGGHIWVVSEMGAGSAFHFTGRFRHECRRQAVA